MRLALVDDSIPFDGLSPQHRPLGGAEKAVAYLAAALARRGHDVEVFNRVALPLTIEGVAWKTLADPLPVHDIDQLIAFRKPALLKAAGSRHRPILFTTLPGAMLDLARPVIQKAKAVVVFQGFRQREGWEGGDAIPVRVIPPGVGPDFAGEATQSPTDPPTAVATTHPGHGMDWLIDLWRTKIHPKAPTARLLLVSALLHRGQAGTELPEALRPVLASALAAAADGVEIVPPRPDPGMAELYRSARVHLYPGQEQDLVSWTLAESQAAGLPAVVRDLGGAPERIRDGQTGHVAPDDDAFANLAVGLLSNDDIFWGMARDARLLQAERTWDVVAAEADALMRGGTGD